VTSALEVFFKNDMRYINSRFTYLLKSNSVQNEDQKPRMRIWKNDKKANGFSVGDIVNLDFPADSQLTIFRCRGPKCLQTAD